MCLATQNCKQDNFRAENFELKTIKIYNNDLNIALFGTLPATCKHEHEIKTGCALNKITGYHITHNYALYPMHILLKGIIPVEIELVLYELVSVQKFVKISDLNMHLNDFFVKNYVRQQWRWAFTVYESCSNVVITEVSSAYYWRQNSA